MAQGLGIIHAAGIHAGETMIWENGRANSAGVGVRDEMRDKLAAFRARGGG
jgi:hypothetical protein